VEQQIRDAGIAFLKLNPIGFGRFDFELLIDSGKNNTKEAAAKLAAAFDAGRLDIDPLRIVLGWGS